jgi:hypothetical protein
MPPGPVGLPRVAPLARTPLRRGPVLVRSLRATRRPSAIGRPSAAGQSQPPNGNVLVRRSASRTLRASVLRPSALRRSRRLRPPGPGRPVRRRRPLGGGGRPRRPAQVRHLVQAPGFPDLPAGLRARAERAEAGQPRLAGLIIGARRRLGGWSGLSRRSGLGLPVLGTRPDAPSRRSPTRVQPGGRWGALVPVGGRVSRPWHDGFPRRVGRVGFPRRVGRLGRIGVCVRRSGHGRAGRGVLRGRIGWGAGPVEGTRHFRAMHFRAIGLVRPVLRVARIRLIGRFVRAESARRTGLVDGRPHDGRAGVRHDGARRMWRARVVAPLRVRWGR